MCFFYFSDHRLQSSGNSFTNKMLLDIIDHAIPSSENESEILDLTMGSLKPINNRIQHYGSVSANGIPTVGKNNLPIGGKLANVFCYNEQEPTTRTATPSKTNPNVMFFHRSSSVMSSARSVSHNIRRIQHTACDDNVAMF